MKILLLLLFPIAFAQAADRPGVEGIRISSPSSYEWVGKIQRHGNFFCTVWILQHGVAITAKHCFTHSGMNSSPQNPWPFTLQFGEKEEPIAVTEIHFDSGENDFVFIRYDKNTTQAKFDLSRHKIFTDPIPANSPIKLIGFPSPLYSRTISENCRTTGITGRFPALPFDSGYEGTFEDTTCSAWYGVSGGVVFQEEANGDILLYGVLTHTFDVLSDGKIDPQYIRRDAFGVATTGMFSPMSALKDLRNQLD